MHGPGAPPQAPGAKASGRPSHHDDSPPRWGFRRMTPHPPEMSPHRAALPADTASKAHMLDVITRGAGATLAVVDRNFVLLYVNDEYARWFGTVPSQLVGKSLAQVYGEPVVAAFMPMVLQVLAGERVQYQRLLRTPYG